MLQNNSYGIYLNFSNFSNISNNDISSNSNSGIFANNSNNNSFISNRVFNNSQYGFYFTASTANNLSLNNATNNTYAQYQFASGSNATFTGENRALQTPAAALDINITGGSNVTTLVGSLYNNLTTENITIFFDSAVNVSIKLLSNNSAAVAKARCSDPTAFEECNLVSFNGFNTVLNITNTSGTAALNLGIYFNPLEFNDSNERVTIKIGKYSNGWLEVGRTAFDGGGSVRYNGITTFSIFGAVAFKAKLASPQNSEQIKKLEMSASIQQICPGNTLKVELSSDTGPVADAPARLILYNPYEGLKQQKPTDVEGRVEFDLAAEKDGRYQIVSSKAGYAKPEDIFFDFFHCKENITKQSIW